MASVPVEYGHCPCSGRYEQRTVEIRMQGDIVLDDVPQGVCLSCGSHVYKAWTLEWIESVYWRVTEELPNGAAAQSPA